MGHSQPHKLHNNTNSCSGNNAVQMRSKINVELSNECLPNINNLRQFFDYSKENATVDNVLRRASYSECGSITQVTTASPQTNINVVAANHEKKNLQKEDQVCEMKSRNIDFERAKKKFDNPSHLLLQHNHQLQQKRQQQQRTSRERSAVRFGAIKNNIGLALPLKNVAATGVIKSGHARSDLQTGVIAADAVVDNIVESGSHR